MSESFSFDVLGISFIQEDVEDDMAGKGHCYDNLDFLTIVQTELKKLT